MSRVLMDDETERRLLANDPSLTSLSWENHRIETTAADCERAALALRQSTHVDMLSLSLHIFDPFVERVLNGEIPGGISDTAVQSFTDWMKSTPNLNLLCLSSIGHSQRSSFHVLPLILSALRMRPQHGVDPIKILTLHDVQVKADDLTMFIQHGRVETLCMGSCTIFQASFSTEQEAIHQVAQSFAANSSITSLSLDVHDSNQGYFVGILAALQTNKTIDRLDLRDDTNSTQLPLPVLNAIVDLFRAGVGPVKTAAFDSFKWKIEMMTPVVQALKVSPMPLKELHLRGGSVDAASCALLQTIYEPGSTIDCFGFDGRIRFPKHDNYQALRDLIGTSPGLKTVWMQYFEMSLRRRRSKQYMAIMRAFTSPSSTVETIHARLLTASNFSALMDIVPYLHSVKAMTLGGRAGDANRLEIKNKIMSAFRCNRSVLESSIACNVLDESDRARLQTYHERNTHLGRILRLVSGNERTWDENGGTILPSLLGASISSGSPVQCLRDILGSLVAAKDLFGVAPNATANKRQAVESPGRSSAKRCKV